MWTRPSVSPFDPVCRGSRLMQYRERRIGGAPGTAAWASTWSSAAGTPGAWTGDAQEVDRERIRAKRYLDRSNTLCVWNDTRSLGWAEPSEKPNKSTRVFLPTATLAFPLFLLLSLPAVFLSLFCYLLSIRCLSPASMSYYPPYSGYPPPQQSYPPPNYSSPQPYP